MHKTLILMFISLACGWCQISLASDMVRYDAAQSRTVKKAPSGEYYHKNDMKVRRTLASKKAASQVVLKDPTAAATQYHSPKRQRKPLKSIALRSH